MAALNRVKISSDDKNVEATRILIHGRCKRLQEKRIWQFFYKVKSALTYDSSITLLGIYSRYM